MNAGLSIDLADLDIAEIGSWPWPLKALCFATLAAAVLGLGYLIILADQRDEFAVAEQREIELRQEFAQHAASAADLPAHRLGLDQAAAALAEMLARLPVDTEVPRLVEDITRAAVDNDLAIGRIELGPERQTPTYRELPIAIDVAGDYHDLGAFAGDIAGLGRLVTLHDFDLVPRAGPRDLTLKVEARTYRYTDSTPPPGSDGPSGEDNRP